MVLDERTRRALYAELERVHGSDHAMALMSSLPGAEVASQESVTGIGRRLDRVEARLDGVEARLDGVEARLDGVEARLDGVEARLVGVEARLVRVDERVNDRLDRLAEIMTAQGRTIGYSAIGTAFTTGSLVLAAVRFG